MSTKHPEHFINNFQDKESACTLNIKNINEGDFGEWKCKAMFWNDWTKGSVDINRFEEGEIEFNDVYGDVVVEQGIYELFL